MTAPIPPRPSLPPIPAPTEADAALVLRWWQARQAAWLADPSPFNLAAAEQGARIFNAVFLAWGESK